MKSMSKNMNPFVRTLKFRNQVAKERLDQGNRDRNIPCLNFCRFSESSNPEQHAKPQSIHSSQIASGLRFVQTSLQGLITSEASKMFVTTLQEYIHTLIRMLNTTPDAPAPPSNLEHLRRDLTLFSSLYTRLPQPSALSPPATTQTQTHPVGRTTTSPEPSLSPRPQNSVRPKQAVSPQRPRVPRLTLTPTREEGEDEPDTLREVAGQPRPFDCEISFDHNRALSTVPRLMDHSIHFRDLDVSVVSDHLEVLGNNPPVTARKEFKDILQDTTDIHSTSLVLFPSTKRTLGQSNHEETNYSPQNESHQRSSKSVGRKRRLLASSKTILVESEETRVTSFRSRAATLPLETDSLALQVASDELNADCLGSMIQASDDLLSIRYRKFLQGLGSNSPSNQSDSIIYSDFVTLFAKRNVSEGESDIPSFPNSLILVFTSRFQV